MTFYEDMQKVANGLLTEFDQGSIQLVRTTNDAPTNSWDPPGDPTEVTYNLSAAARGVSQRYVDGTTILATDGQITMAVEATNAATGAKVNLTPTKATDNLKIDGEVVEILSIEPKPRAGTPAAFVILYRG